MWSSVGTCYARGAASCDFSGSLTMFQCTTWIQPMPDRVSGGKHHAWLSVFLIWQLRLWEGFPRLIGLRNLLQIQLKWEVKRRRSRRRDWGCILFPVGAYQYYLCFVGRYVINAIASEQQQQQLEAITHRSTAKTFTRAQHRSCVNMQAYKEPPSSH